MKIKKATEYDKVSPEMLKGGGGTVGNLVHQLFNKCWESHRLIQRYERLRSRRAARGAYNAPIAGRAAMANTDSAIKDPGHDDSSPSCGISSAAPAPRLHREKLCLP
ncbi:hypothetical protein EVAR_51993_1 [Eumeta japonica]|uniref:Uncharacterized protein n=1 Tax=Eumeta variegata TaxID=151549 RepID=A0A4C1Y5K8_EUMVA|nr:hypothetical protein EVAR_51993_1 [Eumeta japonica]